VLVLVSGLIYEVHRWDGLRWHDLHTEFLEDWFRHSGNIKSYYLDLFRGGSVGTTTERVY
jgi:hypothetical protein